MNNYERIKAMTLDEMAELLICSDCVYCPVSNCAVWQEKEEYTNETCIKNMKRWLQQESEGQDADI